MKIARIIGGVYAVLCVLGLAIMAVGTFGWFGQEKDPLSAVFAVMLAMPWPMVTGTFESPVFGIAVLLGGMALNLAIILAIGRLVSRKGKSDFPE